jgi:hypothetical protein
MKLNKIENECWIRLIAREVARTKIVLGFRNQLTANQTGSMHWKISVPSLIRKFRCMRKKCITPDTCSVKYAVTKNVQRVTLV